MTVFAIILSLIFAIVFPLLISENAITYKPESTYSEKPIQNYFQINGFYLMIFIGLVVISTILIATAKNKSVKLGAYGAVVISTAYYFSVFLKIVKAVKDAADNVTSSTKVSISAKPILMLVLFIAMIICTSIILANTLREKKPISESKEIETI